MQSCDDQWNDVTVKEGTPDSRTWGPLSTFALVLFGKGSFMDDATDAKPGNVFTGCRAYLSHFVSSEANKRAIAIAMDAAAFIVHNAWMTASVREMKIKRLTGPKIQAPDLSATNKIILSVLLDVFLLSLLGVDFSALTPCWRERLDSFATLRIGATIPESFPLMVSYRPDHINVLDKTPGWVSHAASHEEGDEKQDVLNVLERVELTKKYLASQSTPRQL
ncbi:hypothetical protein ISF_09782 [Cordyceps fumosorosea ARSEF 2679]|uniref:Uncharacterized protein n=1 Tax=Cordyceps fumosorosea (strain ARSEF 2679) TaxID=1081104 RepID=A0A167CJ01_CORFA|nr:hypothetical protein ISF_09782 [Cordyceps fumosorosea ARSEF 2679]OAA41250.1 hypothetical protein ISF_09782 [Cordyceps fumosorosea ARSEF 2679]